MVIGDTISPGCQEYSETTEFGGQDYIFTVRVLVTYVNSFIFHIFSYCSRSHWMHLLLKDYGHFFIGSYTYMYTATAKNFYLSRVVEFE